MPGVSLGTVYRNLGRLVESGELQAIARDGAVHYDATLTPHLHFHCRSCGGIFDFEADCADLVEMIEQDLEHQVEGYEFHLTGRCRSCIDGSPAQTDI